MCNIKNNYLWLRYSVVNNVYIIVYKLAMIITQ